MPLAGIAVLACQLMMIMHMSIPGRHADKTNRSFAPSATASHGQRQTATRGEEHRDTHIIVHPGFIFRSVVMQVRSEEDIKRKECALFHTPELHLLQGAIPQWIDNDRLFQPVVILATLVFEKPCRHPRRQRPLLPVGMDPFIGEPPDTVADDKTAFADTCDVLPGIIYFVEYALAEREADFRSGVESAADACLGARRPV